MEATKERRVILTPECQSLWVVSPVMLFFYDKLIMDRQDCDLILNPSSATKLSARRAAILRDLIDWGLVEFVEYRSLLTPGLRSWIHNQSKRLVKETLPQEGQALYTSTFMSRALYAHREFSRYVENIIYFCDIKDEKLLSKNIQKLEHVNKRIQHLETRKATDVMLEEIQWTLERVVAKSFAGLCLARSIRPDAMYDTNEYRPFIADILSSQPELRDVLPDDTESSTFEAVLGALTNKKIPDVTLWDQSEYFRLLRTRDEFLNLRNTLRLIEQLYGALLKEKKEVARLKIQIDIQQLEEEFERELKVAKSAFFRNLTWRAWEMLAGATPAGVLNPIVGKLKECSDAKYEQKVKRAMRNRGGIEAGLFFVSDVWKRRPNLPVLPTGNHKGPISDDVPVWGKGDMEIPWYETA